jgi:ABC-type glycerol-3-phosphate transport system permease component
MTKFEKTGIEDVVVDNRFHDMNQYYKIIIWACCLELAPFPLRAISFMLCAVVTFILFFLFMNILFRKYSEELKSEYILISALIGCSLLQIPLRIWLPDTLVSLPDFLFHLLGIIMGYLFYKSNKTGKTVVLTVSLASCLLELGVNVYPTVLIFDKSGTAIFRGSIENASDYIRKHNNLILQ